VNDIQAAATARVGTGYCAQRSMLGPTQKAASHERDGNNQSGETVPPLVFIVDDDASMREALSSLLRSVGLRVLTFVSAGDFLIAKRPDAAACLVLDVRLPEISGLELQRAMAAMHDTLPVIFITGHGDIPMSVRAMKAGAVEFLTKPFSHRDLLDAVRHALEGDRLARRQRALDLEIKARYDSLTARERQVLRQVVAGKLNKQIAAALGVAEITIKVHRRRVMEKMGAPTLAQLVRITQRVEYTEG
jgi:FixJ family two-component response regulator